MVGHETEGMDSMSIFLYTFLEQEIEAITVRGRKEDVLSPIASKHDVVGGARIMDARLASHDAFFISLYTQLSSLTPYRGCPLSFTFATMDVRL